MMKKKFWLTFLLAIMLAMCMAQSAYAANGIGVTLKINGLRDKYPDGWYWNHEVKTYDDLGNVLKDTWIYNPDYANRFGDTVSQTPCANHNGNPLIGQGQFDCSLFDGKRQCYGFANKIFKDVFGQNCNNAIEIKDTSQVQVGDHVRFEYGNTGIGHSFIVLAKNGSMVTALECNTGYGPNNGNCQISWGHAEYNLNGPMVGYDNYGNKVNFYFKWAHHATNYDQVDSFIPLPGNSGNAVFDTAPAQNLGDDFYAYINHPYSGKYLSNASNNVQIASKNVSDPRQLWHFIRQSDNSYAIINMYDGNSMELCDFGNSSNNVQTLEYNGNTAQRWWICSPYSGYSSTRDYYLVPVCISDHSRVLDMADGYFGYIEDGRNAQVSQSWYGTTNANNGKFHTAQTFHIETMGYPDEPVYILDNPGSDFYARIGYGGTYLTVTGDKSTSTDNVQITRTYANDPKQIWHFKLLSNGKYKITNAYNGWVLNVENWKADLNVSTMIYDGGWDRQRWYIFHSPGESTYRLVSAVGYPWKGLNTLLSLDVYMGYTYEGANVNGYKQNAGVTQKFTLNEDYNYTALAQSMPSGLSARTEYNGYFGTITTLSWDPISLVNSNDSCQYRVRVYKLYDNGAGTLLKDITTKGTSLNYTLAELPEDKYYFSVQVQNTNYPNFSSGIYSYGFTVKAVYKINVGAGVGGAASGGGTFNNGNSVTLRATPSTGYTFTGWQENGRIVSIAANYTFTATADRNITAVFTKQAVQEQKYTITVGATVGGTATGWGTYSKGAQVKLTATPSAGYKFTGWQESGKIVSTSTNYTFTAEKNCKLTAIFARQTYNVTVNANSGGVASGGGAYNENDTVTLQATANPGYKFTGWQENGGVLSTESTYSFKATANRTLMAIFEKLPEEKPVDPVDPNPPTDPVDPDVPVEPEQPTNYTINLNADLAEGGTVSGGGVYAKGSKINVQAEAAPEYNFTGWLLGGQTVSTNAVYSLTADTDVTLTAKFTKKPAEQPDQPDNPVNPDEPVNPGEPGDSEQLFIIQLTSTLGGTVSGAGSYHENDSVTLQAKADEGYKFVGWQEDEQIVSTDGAYTFPATANRELSAIFNPIDGQEQKLYYVVTVSAMPEAGGTVSGDGIFVEKAQVTVTAAVNSGYTFGGWLDSSTGQIVSNDLSYKFTLSDNRDLQAVFTKPGTDTPSTPSTPGTSSSSGSSHSRPASTNTTNTQNTQNTPEPGKQPEPTDNRIFDDVQLENWFDEAVTYVYKRGLVNGTDERTFSPNESTTRGQIVTILYRSEGEPDVNNMPAFSDVASGQYYAKAVAWGAANGIVKGYSETQFAPNDEITREQLAVILYRYAQFKGLDVSAKGDLSSFGDRQNVSDWATEAMEWAVGAGIINGDDKGNISPTANATRAEVAMMLMRFLVNT